MLKEVKKEQKIAKKLHEQAKQEKIAADSAREEAEAKKEQTQKILDRIKKEQETLQALIDDQNQGIVRLQQLEEKNTTLRRKLDEQLPLMRELKDFIIVNVKNADSQDKIMNRFEQLFPEAKDEPSA
jgi:hypothetical protein